MIKDRAEDALPVASALKCAPKSAQGSWASWGMVLWQMHYIRPVFYCAKHFPTQSSGCLSKHTPNSLPVGPRNTHIVSREAGLENLSLLRHHPHRSIDIQQARPRTNIKG